MKILIEEERGREKAGKKKRLKCFIKRSNDTLNVFSLSLYKKQNIFITNISIIVSSHYRSRTAAFVVGLNGNSSFELTRLHLP